MQRGNDNEAAQQEKRNDLKTEDERETLTDAREKKLKWLLAPGTRTISSRTTGPSRTSETVMEYTRG